MQIILIYSAIAASVQAFPGTTRDYETEFYPEPLNQYTGQNAQHVQKPLAMLMEDKSNQKSSTIEFVYKDQEKEVKAEKGSDREMYTHNQNSIEIENNSKINITENVKESNSKNNLKEIIDTSGPNSITSAPIKEISYFIQNKKQDGWLLFPNELFSITSQPRYFYDILPVSPFPKEFPFSKEKMVFKDKVEISQPTLIQKASQPPQIAGPMLYPQSTYSREFDLPFFD